MSIAGDIDVLAVAAEPAVVGNVLRSGNCPAIGGDELYDVRPVDGDGDEVFVHLDDVVGGVAQLVAVPVAEPLVAYHLSVLEVGDASVVSLPHPFVQEDNLFLRYAK